MNNESIIDFIRLLFADCQKIFYNYEKMINL